MGELIKLTCPACGGKLDITEDIERFACSYCGNEYVREGTGLPEQAYVDWGLRITSLNKEFTLLMKEGEDVFAQMFSRAMDDRAAFFARPDAYRQGTQQLRMRADSILSRWRATPTPQDPRVIEIHGLGESALLDVVAAFDEAHAFSYDFDAEHLEEATRLLDSSTEKKERSAELVERFRQELLKGGG